MSETFDEQVTALVAQAEEYHSDRAKELEKLQEQFLDRAKMAIIPVFRKVEANQAVIARTKKIEITEPDALGDSAGLLLAFEDSPASFYGASIWSTSGVTIYSADRSLTYAPDPETLSVAVVTKLGKDAEEDIRRVPIDQIDEKQVKSEVLKFLRVALGLPVKPISWA